MVHAVILSNKNKEEDVNEKFSICHSHWPSTSDKHGRNPGARSLEENPIINYAIAFCNRGKQILAHCKFDKP